MLDRLNRELANLGIDRAEEDRRYIRLEEGSEDKPDLDIEVPNLTSQATVILSPEQQEHLKSLLFALSEKFQSLQSLTSELNILRKANESLTQGRLDLETSLNDTTKHLREEGVQTNRHVAKVQEERNLIAKTLEGQMTANREMEVEVERLKRQVAGLQREVTAGKGRDVEAG